MFFKCALQGLEKHGIVKAFLIEHALRWLDVLHDSIGPLDLALLLFLPLKLLLFHLLLVFEKIESTAQVTNFRYVILRHKYVQSLQIAMNEVSTMHMLESYTKINEYPPDEIFIKIFLQGLTSLRLLLLLEKRTEVTASAVLYNDIDLWLTQLLVDERVVVANNIRRVQRLHRLYLIQCFKLCFLA
jgi:hypothetical protein